LAGSAAAYTTPDRGFTIQEQIMRVRWALGLLTAVLTSSLLVSALPIKPNPAELLEKELYNKKVYPPARVAWNGPEIPRKPFNPVYEAMLYPRSGEAMRQAMAEIAVNPTVLLSIGVVIVLLRMRRREREAKARAKVLTLSRPVKEAA
jgi:hypothetical protein